MPNLGTDVPASDLAPLSDFLNDDGPWGRARHQQRQLDFQIERERAARELNQRKFELDQQKEERQRQQDMQTLQFKQQDEQRAQQEAVRQQEAAVAAAHKADYENYLQENPQTKPPPPELPPKPSYETLGVDPNTLYDQPEEIDKLDQSLMTDIGRRLMVPGPDGAPIPYTIPQAAPPAAGGAPGKLQPITNIPVDTVNQVKMRYFELIRANVPAIEAMQQAENEVIGAHPMLRSTAVAPKPAYSPGKIASFFWGPTEAEPGHAAGIEPDTATLAPKRAIDPSQGYDARKKALEDDYQARMKEWEKKRDAYDNWKPEPYLGYPWKERRAAGGGPAKVAPAPQPQPAPQPAVRKTKSGLTFTVN